MAKYIRLDWIGFPYPQRSGLPPDSTPHYKRLREAKKEGSFSKASMCGGQKERRLRGLGGPSPPETADYQGEAADRREQKPSSLPKQQMYRSPWRKNKDPPTAC